ncbi:hypothetical protein DIPPA_01689 [Diplonema papillatum]|nr:hypothetical protein DIPPA_01689 [Diplonema papillatum]
MGKSSSFVRSDVVYKKVQWHPNVDADLVEVGYLDRFQGLMWTPLKKWRHGGSSDFDSIPWHRVTAYRSDGVVFWDRDNRVDRLDELFAGTLQTPHHGICGANPRQSRRGYPRTESVRLLVYHSSGRWVELPSSSALPPNTHAYPSAVSGTAHADDPTGDAPHQRNPSTRNCRRKHPPDACQPQLQRAGGGSEREVCTAQRDAAPSTPQGDVDLSALQRDVEPGDAQRDVELGTVQRDVALSAAQSDVELGAVQRDVEPGAVQRDVGPGAVQRDEPGAVQRDVEPGAVQRDVGPGAVQRDVEPGAAQRDVEPGAVQKDVEPAAVQTEAGQDGNTEAPLPFDEARGRPERTAAVPPGGDAAADGSAPSQHLRVVSWNVLFQKYATPSTQTLHEARWEALVAEISGASADVVCLQETSDTVFIKFLLNHPVIQRSYAITPPALSTGEAPETMILVRYAVSPQQGLEGRESSSPAAILWPKVAPVAAKMHLYSPHIQTSIVEFSCGSAGLEFAGVVQVTVANTHLTSDKAADAAGKRSLQLRDLTAVLTGPGRAAQQLLLAGDFNFDAASPESFAVDWKGLRDPPPAAAAAAPTFSPATNPLAAWCSVTGLDKTMDRILSTPPALPEHLVPTAHRLLGTQAARWATQVPRTVEEAVIAVPPVLPVVGGCESWAVAAGPGAKVVYLRGANGSGKSTVAGMLLEALAAGCIRAPDGARVAVVSNSSIHAFALDRGGAPPPGARPFALVVVDRLHATPAHVLESRELVRGLLAGSGRTDPVCVDEVVCTLACDAETCEARLAEGLVEPAHGWAEPSATAALGPKAAAVARAARVHLAPPGAFSPPAPAAVDAGGPAPDTFAACLRLLAAEGVLRPSGDRPAAAAAVAEAVFARFASAPPAAGAGADPCPFPLLPPSDHYGVLVEYAAAGRGAVCEAGLAAQQTRPKSTLSVNRLDRATALAWVPPGYGSTARRCEFARAALGAKAFKSWPPHANVVWPYLPVDAACSEPGIRLVRESLAEAGLDTPFRLTARKALKTPDESRGSASISLVPEALDPTTGELSTDPLLAAAQAVLDRIVCAVDGAPGKVHPPHVTLGKAPLDKSSTPDFDETHGLDPEFSPCGFDVVMRELCILHFDPATNRMSIALRIPLGGSSSERPAPPSFPWAPANLVEFASVSQHWPALKESDGPAAFDRLQLPSHQTPRAIMEPHPLGGRKELDLYTPGDALECFMLCAFAGLSQEKGVVEAVRLCTEAPTHISQRGARYHCPGNLTDAYLAFWCKTVSSRFSFFYLEEMRGSVFRCYLDLDVLLASGEAGEPKAFDLEASGWLPFILTFTRDFFFPETDSATLACVVTECHGPYESEALPEIKLKSGFRVFFLDLFVSYAKYKAFVLSLSEAFQARFKTYPDMPSARDPTDIMSHIVDPQAISWERGRLFGTRKQRGRNTARVYKFREAQSCSKAAGAKVSTGLTEYLASPRNLPQLLFSTTLRTWEQPPAFSNLSDAVVPSVLSPYHTAYVPDNEDPAQSLCIDLITLRKVCGTTPCAVASRASASALGLLKTVVVGFDQPPELSGAAFVSLFDLAASVNGVESDYAFPIPEGFTLGAYVVHLLRSHRGEIPREDLAAAEWSRMLVASKMYL